MIVDTSTNMIDFTSGLIRKCIDQTKLNSSNNMIKHYESY